MELNLLRNYGNRIEDCLRLKTYVLGVKLLKNKEEPLNNKLQNPLNDFGYHLSLCQALAISRRKGKALSMFKEDMWCFEPVIALGFEKAPQYFLEGHNRYPLPGSSQSLKAGAKWAQSFPHFELGKYKGIAIAPLFKINFEPDLVLLYCESVQLTELLIAVNGIDGNDINSRLSGYAACAYAIVPVIQNNEFKVTVPCNGDRTKAGTQDDEIIFSFPTNKIDSLVKGIELRSKNSECNLGLPLKTTVPIEYEVRPTYKKISKLMGMDCL